MAARKRGRTGVGVAEGALAVRLWTSASCSRTRVSPSVLRGLEPGALSAPSRPRLSGSVASASALTHLTEGCHRLSCFGKRGFMKFMPRGRWAVSYAESHPGLANTRPGPARPCRPGRGWGAGGSGPPPHPELQLPRLSFPALQEPGGGRGQPQRRHLGTGPIGRTKDVDTGRRKATSWNLVRTRTPSQEVSKRTLTWKPILWLKCLLSGSPKGRTQVCGQPGLLLVAHADREHIICTRIVLRI